MSDASTVFVAGYCNCALAAMPIRRPKPKTINFIFFLNPSCVEKLRLGNLDSTSCSAVTNIELSGFCHYRDLQSVECPKREEVQWIYNIIHPSNRSGSCEAADNAEFRNGKREASLKM